MTTTAAALAVAEFEHAEAADNARPLYECTGNGAVPLACARACRDAAPHGCATCTGIHAWARRSWSTSPLGRPRRPAEQGSASEPTRFSFCPNAPVLHIPSPWPASNSDGSWRSNANQQAPCPDAGMDAITLRAEGHESNNLSHYLRRGVGARAAVRRPRETTRCAKVVDYLREIAVRIEDRTLTDARRVDASAAQGSAAPRALGRGREQPRQLQQV